MQRLTKNPWFGKKLLYGLRPITWQGWLITLIFIVLLMVDIQLYQKTTTGIIILLVLCAAFLIVALLTGDSGSLIWDWYKKRNTGKAKQGS